MNPYDVQYPRCHGDEGVARMGGMVSNDGMTTSPTVKQMTCRSLTGHQKALNAIHEGQPVCSPTARISEVRGMRTVLATLSRWECVDSEGHLTDRGRLLREALNER